MVNITYILKAQAEREKIECARKIQEDQKKRLVVGTPRFRAPKRKSTQPSAA